MTPFASFASDNNSGAHPRIVDAVARANAGRTPAYGEDPLTEEAHAELKRHFGANARPWLVFLGTAANVLGLKSVIAPHHGILCADTAHLNTDECGAPEALVGAKLLTVPGRNGKLRPEDCLPLLADRGDVHRNDPKILSVTQSTERGTVYTVDELRAVSAFCRERGLYLHMDGARLANAAAALDLPLAALTTEAGVDLLSFGGTKNGLLFGEAVVFLNDDLGDAFGFIRKQNLQLMSKMRFMAAQFIEYLKDGLWLENARRANSMAALLGASLARMEHVRIVHPVEVNAVFARMPKNVIAKLRERFYFYILDTSDAEDCPEGWHLVRLMTAFDTKEDEVAEFAAAIASCKGL